jgi:hypothetical protein
VSFAKRHRELAEAFISFVGGYVLFLSKYVVWNGGWDWGPRYLLPCVPLLIIPLGHLVENVSAIRARYCIASLALAGLIVQLPAVYISPNAYYLDMIERIKIPGLFFIENNEKKLHLFNRIADAQIPRQFQIAAGTWVGSRRILGRELTPDLLISTIYRNSPDKPSCVLVLLAMVSLLATLAWVLMKEVESALPSENAIDAFHAIESNRTL